MVLNLDYLSNDFISARFFLIELTLIRTWNFDTYAR